MKLPQYKHCRELYNARGGPGGGPLEVKNKSYPLILLIPTHKCNYFNFVFWVMIVQENLKQ